MDTHTFDALVRSLANRGTRRTLASGLLVAPLAAGISATPENSEARRRKRKKKKKGHGTGSTTTTPGPACEPDCAGKGCGASNGCGGTCQAETCGECQTCAGGACVAVANGTECDDGDKCTANTCQDGVCTVYTRVACDQPRNECRISTCNPDTGFCEEGNQHDNYPCDNEAICMEVQGVCDGAGSCVSGPLACSGLDRKCCPDGPYAGQCKLKTNGGCQQNSQCCSGACVFFVCW
jgi:hypothetical protein